MLNKTNHVYQFKKLLKVDPEDPNPNPNRVMRSKIFQLKNSPFLFSIRKQTVHFWSYIIYRGISRGKNQYLILNESLETTKVNLLTLIPLGGIKLRRNECRST